MALTFDDGPSDWTEPILDILAAHGARATFFVVGSLVEERAGVVRRIADEGHELGNHTWSHPHLARDCDDDRIRDELERTSAVLAGVVGSAPGRFRAPYHDVSPRVESVALKLGLVHTPSSLATPDWHHAATPALIATMVLQRVEPGAVVGLHDGLPPDEAERGTRDVTVAAVATLVPALVARGFVCATASSVLGEPDR